MSRLGFYSLVNLTCMVIDYVVTSDWKGTAILGMVLIALDLIGEAFRR